MKFYRENNINPAASCLPLLAQLPVFFALFFVLRDFANHPPPGPTSRGCTSSRASPTPANSHWSGYLLLAIYAVSQVLSTWFMSTTMDKAQRGIMIVLPLVFISVVAHFPAGLVIYWVTTNLWTVGQGLVTRRLVPKTPAPVARRAEALVADGAARGAEGGGDRRASRAAKPKTPPPQPRRVKRKKGGARR